MEVDKQSAAGILNALRRMSHKLFAKETLMDFFEQVVVEYLRADRNLFINTQCCIQVNEAANPDTSGPHWYCDALTINPQRSQVFLGEISFASQLNSLKKRLSGWHEYWPKVVQALTRDCGIPANWSVRPWLFIPEAAVPNLVKYVEELVSPDTKLMPYPKITTLEMVQPWNYPSWNRGSEAEKPESIPAQMK